MPHQFLLLLAAYLQQYLARGMPRVIDGDGLVDRGVGGQIVLLAFELAVEPAREVAQRLDHGLLGAVRHGLPGRAVALDLDRDAALVAVVAACTDGRVQLPEVAFLDRLQFVRDAVQLLVFRRMGADSPARAVGMAVLAFKRGAIAV